MRLRKLPGELDPHEGPAEPEIPSAETIMAEARLQAQFIANSTGEDFDSVWKRFRSTAERVIADYA